MTMITPSYLGETIEYSSLHACRSTLEDPTIIDGGTAATGPILRERIERIDPCDRHFELLVVTHIDTDHIDGVLMLLKNPPDKVRFDEIWFNGYRQLSPGFLGARQGEYLAAYTEKILQGRLGTWNGAFNGKAVVAPETGDFPRVDLDGGLRLTVLAPGKAALEQLRDRWDEALAEIMTPGNVEEAEALLRDDKRYGPGFLGALDVEGLANRDFHEDTSVTNASGIVLLAEYDGHRCLLCADGVPGTITESLGRLPDGGKRLALSALKVPHHGSRKNNNNELYRAIDCERYLISTNGKTHRHPNDEAIARVLFNKQDKAKLFFNYRSPYNEVWAGERLKTDWRYCTEYPEKEDSGLRVDL